MIRPLASLLLLILAATVLVGCGGQGVQGSEPTRDEGGALGSGSRGDSTSLDGGNGQFGSGTRDGGMTMGGGQRDEGGGAAGSGN